MLRRFFGGAPAAQAAAKPGQAAKEATVEEFHELARDFTTRGLEYDERGMVQEALNHYRQGLEVLEEGLSLGRERGSAGTHMREMATWQRRSRERAASLEARMASAAAPAADRGPGPAQRRGSRDRGRLGAAPPRPRAPARPQPAAGAAPVRRDPELRRGGRAKDDSDRKLRQMIEEEIVDTSPGVAWDDVAGAAAAKQALQEMVILPATRPDLFGGLRTPTKGLLLYGPPGNGKTMLAKAVASAAKCTFFSISASSLTSKWVGESEKLVKALFQVARERAPALIFIDEIDSLLSARNAVENESSRRLKTEFLVQFDGVGSDGDARLFIVGATNRPQELDDAVRRRLPKRIYLPLPPADVRAQLIARLLQKQPHKLRRTDIENVALKTLNYSGSDLKELCQEAAMVPIRELGPERLKTVSARSIRKLTLQDFFVAMQTVRPSASPEQLEVYRDWTQRFGTQ